MSAAAQLDQWTHLGWTISFDMPPIPFRGADWQVVHPDYDASWEGEEDGWVSNGLRVTAGTYEDLLLEIECAQADWDDDNGQFGVGA